MSDKLRPWIRAPPRPPPGTEEAAARAREEAREKNKRGDALVNMPVPFIEARETSFLNSLKVAIGAATEAATIASAPIASNRPRPSRLGRDGAALSLAG